MTKTLRVNGVGALVRHAVNDNFQPLHQAFEDGRPLEVVQGNQRRYWAEWRAEHGEFQRATVMGTSSEQGDPGVLVRLEFARGVLQQLGVVGEPADQRFFVRLRQQPDVGLADVALVVYVRRLESFMMAPLWSELKHLNAWYEKIAARPAYVRAVVDWGDITEDARKAHGTEAFDRLAAMWTA